MQGTTLSDSRTYPGKVRLGFALFFGGAAWLIILGVVASLPILILHPTGTGGPLPTAIIVPIGVCAATILAAPGAVICVLRPSWLPSFYPRAWRTAVILCYSIVVSGLLAIAAFALYASYH